MGKSMDKGNAGHNNKPKLSIEEKKQKKKNHKEGHKVSQIYGPQSAAEFIGLLLGFLGFDISFDAHGLFVALGSSA